ncbi:MAG: peptidylprolyl isomerase, partial [Helicobacteraceae bacterium]|jgi:peptidylprolyl isomerase|nr:peptidylprolyl isomerase [Helicobacteraceae bacterium]
VKRVLVLAAFAASSLCAATLATVNGDKITSEEINILLSQNPQAPSYEQLTDEQKKEILDRVVEQTLLVQQAKKDGVEKDAEYNTRLNALRESLLFSTYLKKKSDSIKVTDAEAKKFYEENKARLERPETVRARHILVEKEGDAKTIIKALSGKKGADLEAEFEKLAKEKSIDPGSAERGGDLGYFSQDRMVKEFSDAAFALKNGEITKNPVKSDFGYHVILKVDHKKAGLIPFDEVAEQIRQGAKSKKFEEAVEKEIEALKAKAKISYQ